MLVFPPQGGSCGAALPQRRWPGGGALAAQPEPAERAAPCNGAAAGGEGEHATQHELMHVGRRLPAACAHTLDALFWPHVRRSQQHGSASTATTCLCRRCWPPCLRTAAGRHPTWRPPMQQPTSMRTGRGQLWPRRTTTKSVREASIQGAQGGQAAGQAAGQPLQSCCDGATALCHPAAGTY